MELFNQDVAAQVTELRANLTKLADIRDSDFAVSLCAQFERKGQLSERQLPYVARLLAKAKGEPEQRKAAAANLGDLSPVIALFDRAAKNLKYPKLAFDDTVVGVPLRLQRTSTGREPGSVCCTDGGRYGANLFYGRIHRGGSFTPGPDCPEELVPFLEKLGSDTANVAAMYGKKSGACCFCDKTLDDERSTEVGYGPVCAKKWGLPYPTKTEVRRKKAGQKDLLAA